MLKQSRHKKRGVRRAGLLLTGLLLVPLGAWTMYRYAPDWSQLAERAALSSAMLNMPEGTAALLRRRFADKMDPDLPNQEAMNPWPTATAVPEKPESTPAPEKKPATKPAVGPDKLLIPSPAIAVAEIPEKYRGTLLQENMAGVGSNLLSYGAGKLRNYTEVPDAELLKIIEQGNNIILEDTEEPQVLLFHTHATESYEPLDSETFDMRNTWRDTDNNKNMIAVGNAMEKELRAAGIGVIHDKTLHDYPSYNGAYDRSAETIRGYLKRYPTIKVVLDIHRDAILRADDLTVKPVVEIDGKKAAQLMIITGAEDGQMNVPKWRENLRFAASVQDAIERDSPQLTRPIFFCYRKYNMDLTTGSLLFEMGANGNTLEESIYSAQLIGRSIGKLLTDEQTPVESKK